MKELIKCSIKFIIRNKNNIFLVLISLGTNIEHLTKNWFYFLVTIIIAVLTVWLNINNDVPTKKYNFTRKKIKDVIFMSDYVIKKESYSNTYGKMFQIINLNTGKNHYLFSHRRKQLEGKEGIKRLFN